MSSSDAATERTYREEEDSHMHGTDQDRQWQSTEPDKKSQSTEPDRKSQSPASDSSPMLWQPTGVMNRRGGLSHGSRVESEREDSVEGQQAHAINTASFAANSSATHAPLEIRYIPHSRQGSVSSHSNSHSRQGSHASHPHSRQGSITGLQIRTDLVHPAISHIQATTPTRTRIHASTTSPNLTSTSNTPDATNSTTGLHPSSSSNHLHRTISAASLNSSLSPNGQLGSPALAAMVDITPLPSPVTLGESASASWRRVREKQIIKAQYDRSTTGGVAFDRSTTGGAEPVESSPLARKQDAQFHRPGSPASATSLISPTSPSRKVKGYGSLASAMQAQRPSSSHGQPSTTSHTRNRSVSDFIPEPLHNIPTRHITLAASDIEQSQHHPMHREQYLAAQRGMLSPVPPGLPSPPPSNKSITGSDMEDEVMRNAADHESDVEYFYIRGIQNTLKKHRWRALRPLGQGTFSKVMLATSEQLPPHASYTEDNLDANKLVAVKIVEHGPAGGADEERIEVSLRREVEILKTVKHPCIVQLKAMEYTEDRALLVLTYCPGGDLFELASSHGDLLTRPLVQRMFAELLSAVRYLHEMGVVHRDLKLENVLVYPRAEVLATIKDPQSYRHPLISLTDLGLSRRIPPPPASPLLTTRCGSEDYAAPEILLGQPYDGRSTDAWALGVLLYALMEGRLPFDCPPGVPERSRVSHRVARCDWIWTRYGDEDGEWDASKDVGGEWRGAGEVVEALLKKVRMGRKSLKEVEGWAWVREGIKVEGGAAGLIRVDDGVGEL